MHATLELPVARTSDRKTHYFAADTAPEDHDANDVQLARAGSREAFDRLVRKHQHAVINTAAYCLSNPDDAFDTAQETFLKAFKGLKHFRGSSSFRTWVLRIAVNSARSLATRERALKRGGATASRPERSCWSAAAATDRDIPHPWSSESPAKLLERREVKRALEGAIAALDDSNREVITLRDLALLSYEAIAKHLNLPLGTVKSRVHRARLILREKLAPHL